MNNKLFLSIICSFFLTFISCQKEPHYTKDTVAGQYQMQMNMLFSVDNGDVDLPSELESISCNHIYAIDDEQNGIELLLDYLYDGASGIKGKVLDEEQGIDFEDFEMSKGCNARLIEYNNEVVYFNVCNVHADIKSHHYIEVSADFMYEYEGEMIYEGKLYLKLHKEY